MHIVATAWNLYRLFVGICILLCVLSIIHNGLIVVIALEICGYANSS